MLPAVRAFPLPERLQNMTLAEAEAKAQKAEQGNPLPFHAAGLIYESQGRLEDAKRCYRLAVDRSLYIPALERLQRLWPEEFSWAKIAGRCQYLGRLNQTVRLQWCAESAELGSWDEWREIKGYLRDEPAQVLFDEAHINRIKNSYLNFRLEKLLSDPKAYDFKIASIYKKLGKIPESMEWYAKAACRGSVEALNILEAMMRQNPTSPIDFLEVVASYQKVQWRYYDESAQISHIPSDARMSGTAFDAFCAAAAYKRFHQTENAKTWLETARNMGYPLAARALNENWGNRL